jgi:hypothetical protein
MVDLITHRNLGGSFLIMSNCTRAVQSNVTEERSATSYFSFYLSQSHRFKRLSHWLESSLLSYVGNWEVFLLLVLINLLSIYFRTPKDDRLQYFY